MKTAAFLRACLAASIATLLPLGAVSPAAAQAEVPAEVIAAAKAGEPLMFVSGDAAEGRIYGYHTIQNVEEDRSFIDAAGTARKNAYSIKLKLYEGEAGGAGGIASFISLFG